MISQVANTANYTPGGSALPAQAPVADIQQPQPSAAPVELPRKAVSAVDAPTVDVDTVKKAAEQINKVLQQMDRDLQFTVDEETGTKVVKVIDTQSKDVIRQMPTPEMLTIAKALDKLQGLLIREKA